MKLDNWFKKWHIPYEAREELKELFIQNAPAKSNGQHSPGTEAELINIIRLEASKNEARLWRNNVGAAQTKSGSFVRYGLANDSTDVNSSIKSADLIGIRSIRITQDMVGKIIGQFISREVKRSNWTYSNSAREAAQMRWIELINIMGGDACFTTGEGTFK